jgi:hypothetical protein
MRVVPGMNPRYISPVLCLLTDLTSSVDLRRPNSHIPSESRHERNNGCLGFVATSTCLHAAVAIQKLATVSAGNS